MDYCGCTKVARQSVKRKRFDECDECEPAKRALTEEAMANYLHQLNISSLASPPLPPPPLDTLAASVSTALEQPTSSCGLTRRNTLACDSHYSENGYRIHSSGLRRNNRESTPPALNKPQCVSSTPTVEGLDLATSDRLPGSSNSIRIKVTPATPPSSVSTEPPSHEECEPMEETPMISHSSSSSSFSPSSSLSCRSLCKNWDVILEDISSDSSDTAESSEMPWQLWIDPSLQNLTSASKNLPFPILDTITRKDMAVVPWVEREKYLNDIIVKAQISSANSDDSEESQQNKPQEYTMHTD